MSQAVITQPNQPWKIATMTRVIFSGMDSSFVAGLGYADCVLRCRSMVWDFGDQTTLIYGWQVSHIFALAGTYTVTLTVTWDDGSVSTATTSVTIVAVPSFATFTKYVDPSRPDDNGDGNTPATAYKTLEHAFLVWRDGFPRTQWGVIYLPKGTNIPFLGLNDFTTWNKSPNQGPLFITGYGTGTRPNLQISAGVEIDVDSSGAQDRPVYVDGVDCTWAVPGTGYWSFNNDCGQIQNSIFTNGSFGSMRGQGSSAFNLTVTKAYNTQFINCDYADFESCTFKGNGLHGDNPDGFHFDHQVYDDGSHQSFRNCTFDATGAVGAYAGLKVSGGRKIYVVNPICIGNDCGFDIGANPDNSNTQDYVIENPVLNGILRFGFYADICDRISIRNPIVYGGCADSVLRLQSFSSSQMITDLQMYFGSFYKPVGNAVHNTNGNLLRVLIWDCITQKAANSGPFLKAETGGFDFANIGMAFNCYYRDGGAAGDSGFALMGATDYSFTAWIGTGIDTGAKYADPKFTGANDLHLLPGSPCVDAGIAVGVIGLDAYGKTRPYGNAYDIGADESTGGGGAGYLTFRQYFSEIRTGFTQLGFESFDAINACIVQAIASNPVCNLNGLAWVYPGTDDSLPNHVFVFKHKRWERGLTLWYVICGQDDGTEAHETGIPGYAMAMGYDSTLQGLMDRYSTDVGDPTNSSKSTHYEICWRRKQDAVSAPSAPPAPLNPIFSETTTGVVTPFVNTGGTQRIQLAPPIFSETRTTPNTLSNSPQTIQISQHIFSESYVGVVVPFIAPTQNIQLLKIFSRSAVNDITANYVPAQGHYNLFAIWAETNAVQLDYTIQGGNSGFNLLAIFSETQTDNPGVANQGGTNPQGLNKIWSESLTTVPDVLVIGAVFRKNLAIIWSESWTQPLDYQIQGGSNQNVGIVPIWSETATLAPSSSTSGTIKVPLLSMFSESWAGSLDTTEIDPGVFNLVGGACDTATMPVTATLISTPQATSIGDFSGGVELEGAF
jgi:PKD repeat protein